MRFGKVIYLKVLIQEKSVLTKVLSLFTLFMIMFCTLYLIIQHGTER
nr:MAG TPA: hypothetical protein [Caudoviricetes sp.]